MKLPKGDQAPASTVLAYTIRENHGHYFVVRPVGHSGRLAQVLDQGRGPIVVDAAELYASPEWTGLVLVPQAPNWPLRGVLGAAACLALGYAWLRFHARRFR